MTLFSESVVEDAALARLGDLGYTLPHGSKIALVELLADRSDPCYPDVVLEGPVPDALLPQPISGALRAPAAEKHLVTA